MNRGYLIKYIKYIRCFGGFLVSNISAVSGYSLKTSLILTCCGLAVYLQFVKIICKVKVNKEYLVKKKKRHDFNTKCFGKIIFHIKGLYLHI